MIVKEIESEKDLEIRIRNKLTSLFSDSDFILLENKDVVDIVILNDKTQKLFFIELKFFKKSHLRLGTGSEYGKGFQIEILERKFAYFESNLRWILATEEDDYYRFCTNEQIRKNICNDLGKKYNSISKKLFESDEITKLTEGELIKEINHWLNQ